MKKFITAIIILLSAFTRIEAQFSEKIIVDKYTQYTTAFPEANLHLTFNQEKYAPGDTVWFKAYFLKSDLTGIEGKQLIEVNLVDSKGISILHFLFSVNNGIGNSQVIIPDSLSEGFYLFTAHSNWMRNFIPFRPFQKEIEIVKENMLLAIEEGPLMAVEGGHLISDVANKIAIISTRIGSTVHLVDESGVKVAHTKIDQRGTGSLIFIPTQNKRYHLQGQREDFQIPLPKAELEGCGLMILHEKINNLIKIQITGSSLPDQKLFLVITARNKIHYSTTVAISAKEVKELTIQPQNLPNGIVQVSVLGQTGALVANRVFHNSAPEQVKVDIQSASNTYDIREKVKLNVTLTAADGKPLEGEFSISVINESLFDTLHLRNTELTAPLRNYHFEMNPADSSTNVSIDNMLIVQGEKLAWNNILSKKSEATRFQFSSVIEKTGRAYYWDTMKPVPDYTQILFYLQKQSYYYQTFTEWGGKFSLTIPDFYGDDEFFYIASKDGNEIEKVKIIWENQTIDLPKASPAKNTGIADRYAAFHTKERLIHQSFNSYSGPVQVPSKQNSTESTFEINISKADITLNTDDYAVFPTMEEMVKEIVPGIFHRKNSKKNIVRVKLLAPMLATAEPVYIIDGIATKNTDFFLSLKPIDLITIKIFNNPKKLKLLGLLGREGIIIVQTKSGDARETLDDPSKKITGLNPPLNFNLPDYSNAENFHKPYFKSTLYWNPSVTTDADGKASTEFFCSDDVASILIRINGMTKSAEPFSATKKLNVILPKK